MCGNGVLIVTGMIIVFTLRAFPLPRFLLFQLQRTCIYESILDTGLPYAGLRKTWHLAHGAYILCLLKAELG